jgi:nitroreductase
MLMAESLGLGTCLTGYASEALQVLLAARAELGLPETNRVYHVVTAGRPAETFRLVPPRKSAQVRWL